jgi:hypothetical protein
MFKAIFSCVRRVFSDASTWGGVVSGGIGSLSDYVGHAIVAPSWIWWGMAVCLLFLAACRAHWDLERERDKKHVPLPDIPLEEVVARVVGVRPSELFSDDNPQKTSDALGEIREKAGLGAVLCWGRRNAVHSNLIFYPREEIDREVWINAQIDYLKFIRDRKCDLGIANGQPTGNNYSDIHFNREQVDAVWPKRKQRMFSLRSPIVKVTP